MATCTLDKYTKYDVSAVKKDVAEGRFIVNLAHPPATCSEGIFTSKKVDLVVDKHLDGSLLTFNTAKNRPVILVQNEKLVQNINVPETSLLSTALWITLFAGVAYVIYRLFRNETYTPAVSSGAYSPYTPSSTYRSRNLSSPTSGGSGGGTTVVNNNTGGNDGLLTGLVLGNMMASHSETVHERTVYRERDEDTAERSSSYNSDDDDTSSSSSSYSSDDSGSSYSSDSGSSDSYSSDSSSFSSDSGSSFDSGGGSFSSD